ncbi:hypothetical protein AB0M54_32370 [Actinoplanes sp. NPDC051470]|uniref:hypothetical protein n=1 Tax=Actinoplanes sp. NPDC051470 TaxID=3157224 RepID=UPI003442F3C3
MAEQRELKDFAGEAGLLKSCRPCLDLAVTTNRRRRERILLCAGRNAAIGHFRDSEATLLAAVSVERHPNVSKSVI